jgi:hypothetical protein
MRVLVRELMGDTVCAGAQAGHVVLVKLLSHVTREPALPEPVFLDFEGVEVATASFLRESVLSFRDLVRKRRSFYYPVVANTNEKTREELLILLDLKGDALLSCDLDKDERDANVQLLGRLEGKQQLAFELVEERGETDATQLQIEFGESEGVKQTAWNNRLAALAASGLIVETSQGRAKKYRPLLRGVQGGR